MAGGCSERFCIVIRYPEKGAAWEKSGIKSGTESCGGGSSPPCSSFRMAKQTTPLCSCDSVPCSAACTTLNACPVRMRAIVSNVLDL